MPLSLPLPWPRREPPDPFWDAFINRAPADPHNQPAEAIRRAPEGSVFAIKADVHTPEVMATHLKELGRFFGADAVGIVRRRDASDGLPYALVCGLRAPHDPERARGTGGQRPVLHGAYVTFNLGAAIREFGFRATRVGRTGAMHLAVLAGLGEPLPDGRVASRMLGPLYIADVIHTDLPVAPDAQEEPA